MKTADEDAEAATTELNESEISALRAIYGEGLDREGAQPGAGRAAARAR